MVAGRITKRQKKKIAELEKIARTLGIRVSAGDLRFAGLRLKGGQCLFRGETWVVVDRRQPFEDQVDVLSEAIGALDWEQLPIDSDLEKMIRKSIGGPSGGPVRNKNDNVP